MAKNNSKAKQTQPADECRAALDWLERQYLVDGPEKIVCRVLHKPNFETLGAMVEQVCFPPATPKPTREDLVVLAERFVRAMQHDADAQRRTVVYGIFAYRFARDCEFSSRYLHRCDLPEKVSTGLEVAA